MKKTITLLTLTLGVTLMSLGGTQTSAKTFSREMLAGGPPPSQPTSKPNSQPSTTKPTPPPSTPQTRPQKPTSGPNSSPHQTLNPWFNCRTREVWTPEKSSWCEKVEKMKNTSYQLPGLGDGNSPQNIQLQNGVYQNSSNRHYFGLLDQSKLIVFADVNKDNKSDGIGLIAVNRGKSGFLVYLVMVSDVVNAPKNVSSTLLGEGVNVQSIHVNQGKIEVEMIKPNPLTRITQTYVLERNQLKLMTEK